MKSLALQPDMDIFINLFRRIKRKVIIKYRDESINVPDFILIKKRVNQNDVLGHPYVKLYISNGHISGIQEAAYHKVPMIIIPLYGDQVTMNFPMKIFNSTQFPLQFENAKKVEKSGVGICLPVQDLSSEILYMNIILLLNDKKYMENIERVSEIFRSDFQPIEKVVYWIEHTLKFNEDYLFRPAVNEAPWYEYLFLDFFCMFIIGALLIWSLLGTIYNRCCCCCKGAEDISDEEEFLKSDVKVKIENEEAVEIKEEVDEISNEPTEEKTPETENETPQDRNENQNKSVNPEIDLMNKVPIN